LTLELEARGGFIGRVIIVSNANIDFVSYCRRWRRQAPVLPQQEHGDADGDQHDRDVSVSKARYSEGQYARAEEYDRGRKHVAAPHEEGVDGLLSLVLFLTGGEQPKHLLRRVHDRVGGAVLR